MRTAALPSFRKVWGKVWRAEKAEHLAEVDTKLPAGTRLRVYVEHHFPTKEFYGQKAGHGEVWGRSPLLEAFVMSTASVVGGRSIERQPFVAVSSGLRLAKLRGTTFWASPTWWSELPASSLHQWSRPVLKLWLLDACELRLWQIFFINSSVHGQRSSRLGLSFTRFIMKRQLTCRSR